MRFSIFQPNLERLSDEQAMWRVSHHDDPEAFAILVRRWEPPLQRLCHRMTGDLHRAQDLTQDAFARLFARRKTYRPEAKVSTFLWRIALNLCYDALRRTRFDPPAPAADEPVPPEATDSHQQLPDQHLILSERAQAVRDALLDLPDLYRAVVVLRHYENLKFQEIASLLGIPEGTVKSRMVEALTQLRRRLAKPPTRAQTVSSPSKPLLPVAL